MYIIVILSFILHTIIYSLDITLPGGCRIKFENGGIIRIITSTSNTPLPKPPSLNSLPTQDTLSSIQIQDTGTIKGYGAYCINKPLPSFTFLGFYQGERITTRETLDQLCSASKDPNIEATEVCLIGFCLAVCTADLCGNETARGVVWLSYG